MLEKRSDKRLDGWKDIAAYLAIEVRTAQKWEKEQDLPVRRLRDGQRPRVFAFVRELDDWRRAQEQRASSGSASYTRRVLPAVVAGLVIISAVLLFLGLRTDDPVALKIAGEYLEAYDADGRRAFRRHFPQLDDAMYVRAFDNSGNLILDALTEITNVDGHPGPEVLFSFAPALPASHTLYCLTGAGEVLWTYEYGAHSQQPLPELEGYYHGQFLFPVEQGGHTYVVAVSVHDTDHPAHVALLDGRTGELLDYYWHPGRFYGHALLDVDDDKDAEVLLYGLNNPASPGHPALVVLNIPFDTPASNPHASQNYYGPSNAKEAAYLLFPRIPAFAINRNKATVQDVYREASGNIRVSTGAVAAGHLHTVLFSFDPTLSRIVAFQAGDTLIQYHTELYNSGILDHEATRAVEASWATFARFPTAPDGDAPTTVKRLSVAPPE